MMKMMTFDPQKRITPVQALKHPYFEGFVLNLQPTPTALPVANASNKNFFNAANAFTEKPGSKHNIESRKGVLSRKSSINKNSFYRSKAVGKLPDYLPNKPTVVGSRGQPYSLGNKLESPALPSILGSGGIAGNQPIGSGSPYKK
jgi:serine/threonine protein kinase